MLLPRLCPNSFIQAALPDGTYIIMNGAHKGVAGFGLAEDPNLQAILYDPSQPTNQRMSRLASTDIARMYHSEATLLPDGRVLVSGSDPQTYYPDGSEIYPEEFRVEVYNPSYLTSGLPRPSFQILEKDWTYGSTHAFTTSAPLGNIRVSLIGGKSISFI